MKKLVLFLFSVVVYTTGLTAQDLNSNQEQIQGHIMIVNGDVLLIQDNHPIPLQSRITLSDGTLVNPDGTYQTKDFKRFRLHDGECLDNDGIKYRNECQYRNKVIQENKGLTLAKIKERNQLRFQLRLLDGEMFKIMNKSQKRLITRIKLENGTVVYPDGSWQSPENKKVIQLIDGECLSLKGEMFHNTCIHQEKLIQKSKINIEIQ